MITMVLRKIANNRWMVACLLIGVLLAVAMVSSIPIYTDGVLQRMLTRDLEAFQEEEKSYPGTYLAQADLRNGFALEDRASAYAMLNRDVQAELFAPLGLPAIAQTNIITMDMITGYPRDTKREDEKRSFKVSAVEGYEEHVVLTAGRLPAGEPVAGVYELVMPEVYYKQSKLQLDTVYEAWDTLHRLPDEERIYFMVVGVVNIKDPQDLFWYNGFECVRNGFLMDPDLFKRDFLQAEPSLISSASWHYAFDYRQLTLDRVSAVQRALVQGAKWADGYGSVTIQAPVRPVIEAYAQREVQVRSSLLVLQIPVLILIVFYLFMVSRLIVEYENPEIAVLRSRGASRGQVFSIYLLQSLLLGIPALLTGLGLGYLICLFVGSSNGFLEFIGRKALPLSLTAKAVWYAVAAAVLSILTMLIPALFAAKTTIVQQKRRRGRKRKLPLWELMGLDVLLIAGSLYGLYTFGLRKQLTAAAAGAEQGAMAPVDPLLYLLSIMFIMGCGLLIVRLYPYLIRLLFLVTKKTLSPVLYASFIHVGRSRGQERFLILFLVATLAIGIFSANSARTVNQNTEERARYAVGTDITLQRDWDGIEMTDPDTGDTAVLYREPDYQQYAKLEGIEAYTKVYRYAGSRVSNPQGNGSIQAYVMGVIPHEFAKVAWFRADLTDVHPFHYLNAMTQYPEGILISRGLAQRLEAEPGDRLEFTWKRDTRIACTILGVMDYWPSYNPFQGLEGARDPGTDSDCLIVANLNNLFSSGRAEPYEVWLKKAPGATSAQVYASIEANAIAAKTVRDADQDIIKAKNDPLLQGTNGAMTMGFIAIMVICLIGFIIYWVLSIKGRSLQFGVFRAICMPMRKVLGMLVCEQLMISGVAIVLGVAVGSVASQLFVPLLEVAYSTAQQVPPFRVVANAGDYVKIFCIMGAMLVVGCAILGSMISRIRMSQAIKLGED